MPTNSQQSSPQSPRRTLGEELPPPIYSAPTTDTLGDEPASLFSRPYALLQTPSRSQHHFLSEPGSASRQHQRRSAPTTTATPGTTRTSAKPRSSKSQRHHRRRRTTHRGDFQNPLNATRVTVQTVDVAQRSAFKVRPPLSLADYQAAAKEAALKKGKSIAKRLSPSYQHLKILHQLHGTTIIRQVHFSPSVSLDSDCLYVMAHASNDNDVPLHKHHHKRLLGDGRYRSIHPVQATVAALPAVAPTHKKTRLPMRPDVGFQHASEEEMLLKQDEIRHETACEQASPRLVVLVMSDDLGSSSTTTVASGSSARTTAGAFKQQQHHPDDHWLSPEHVQWNGGGLVLSDASTIPHAGRELLQAAARNARHFGKPFQLASWRSVSASANNSKLLQPNPYSMLAPPLDASYSPSQGWRPRPFHDRPAGRSYFLACPLQVSLPASAQQVQMSRGDNSFNAPHDERELTPPLLASLALYTLPPSGSSTGSGAPPLCGKMSEEFWFPVLLGDDNARSGGCSSSWRGLINTTATRRTGDGCVDQELVALWLERHKKAIFSYSPLDEAVSSNGIGSLYLVLRAYNMIVSRVETSAALQDDDDSEINKSGESTSPPQLLEPVCFGVTEAVHASPSSLGAYPPDDNNVQWPRGETREMQLYSNEGNPESQESFVQRLSWLVRGRGKPMSEQTQLDDSETSEGEDSEGANHTGKMRRGVARMFRSPMKSSKPRASPVPPATHTYPNEAPPIQVGKANLFVSILPVDFLQSMLANPVELQRPTSFQRETSKRRLPRLLVDVSGDFAVALEDSQSGIDHQQPVLPQPAESVKKRSNLLRLPAASEPAGYAGSFEYREVLNLPVRPEKHYFFDSALSYRSAQNLLYLYPHLLRQSAEMTDGGGKLEAIYTVRLRAIRTESALDEESGTMTATTTPLLSFHNPASWSSGNLLDQVFTSVILGGAVPSQSRVVDERKSSLPMNDEFKLRLPPLLDGSYSLELALFEVHRSGDSNTKLKAVGVTSVPLSSSAPREGMSGGRIATAIPNGNHRLKLGDFQLQLETRLVSSIHVGDPLVATALRDFPYVKENDILFPPQMRSSYNANSLRTHSFESSLESSASFDPLLLSNASPSATVGHFHALMHMHLWNFMNVKDGTSLSLRDNIRSMFEVLTLAKCRLQPRAFLEPPGEAVQAFVKKFLDDFDEGSLSKVSVSHFPHASVETSLDHASADNQTNTSVEETGDPNDEHDGGAVRIRTKSSTLGQSDSRITRKILAVGTPGAPFSRVAYGATKTDRMRLQAELRYDSSHGAPFFDDDETVLTAFTMQSDARRNMPASDNSVVFDGSFDNLAAPTMKEVLKQSQPQHGNQEFANRVRTVAQVMLAPCVGPSLSNILAGKSSPRHTDSAHVVVEKESKPSSLPVKPFSLACFPGSDDEDSINDDESPGYTGSEVETVVAFRGPSNAPLLRFSLEMDKPNEIPTGSGDYIYESIVILWLRAWLDHVESTLKKTGDRGAAGRVATFSIPPFDPESTSDPDVFCFYAHMDYLLPLCLKSIILRYCVAVSSNSPSSAKAILDESHMLIFEAFVELLARGLVGQGLSGLGSSLDRDRAIVRALSASEIVLEFLVGLLSVLHPQHMNVLLTKYFNTLRDCETEHLEDLDESHFQWTEESLHRVRCSRQLRIRAIEVLASLPSFLALNYPLKFSVQEGSSKLSKSSWTNQYKEIEIEAGTLMQRPLYEDGIDRLPKSGWLAELLISAGLSVCSLSCEAVVAEAMAHMEVSRLKNAGSPLSKSSALKRRPGAALMREDLLMFQSLAIHAITCIYELLLRRHAMDRRYQNESSRGRIAALFAHPILVKSIASVRWLARMESTQKVRSIWLLSFIYVLQEAPDSLMRDFIRSCCNPEEIRIHRFIRLLRLCSSTFQSFVELPKNAAFPSYIGKGIAPWLLQESFNTICATTNTVVEECVLLTSSYPREQEKMMHGILDLLLHVLTTPQSSVTHLRAVGGALQALEKFGVSLFLEIAGDNLQNWIRVILSLMNSVSLAVRSIAVDFVVSLLGSAFDLEGNIDHLSIIFVSVLPEVAAREIGLYSVSGHISSIEDVSKTLWPLRRSFADLEDANPLDDDRIDPQLPPILNVFCRACQAVMDGVLIELRLKGDVISIVGTQISRDNTASSGFDADEESLFEVADFFVPEIGPLQRIRWLSTLAALHESKGQWVEAAETLFLCARTITEAIPHLQSGWRPSQFSLWSDTRRSLWLETVGEEVGRPDRGNAQVMDFAQEFLEPAHVAELSGAPTGKLLQPTLPFMCSKLAETAKKAVNLYLREEGLDELAYARLEAVQNALSSVLEEHEFRGSSRGLPRYRTANARKHHVGDEAEMLKVLTSISGDMTRLAGRLLLIVRNETATPETQPGPSQASKKNPHLPCFVLLRLSGKKPTRFQESTTLPTFVEWNTPCICRVPRSIVEKPAEDPKVFAQQICQSFADPFLKAFKTECGADSVVFCTTADEDSESAVDENKTFVHVYPVEAIDAEPTSLSYSSLAAKRFLLRGPKALVELTVAHTFPCALSRQRVLFQSEIASVSHHDKHFFAD